MGFTGTGAIDTTVQPVLVFRELALRMLPDYGYIGLSQQSKLS